jgi:hypothetical protein
VRIKDAILNLFFLCQNPLTERENPNPIDRFIKLFCFLNQYLIGMENPPSKNEVKVLHKKVAFVNAWPQSQCYFAKEANIGLTT